MKPGATTPFNPSLWKWVFTLTSATLVYSTNKPVAAEAAPKKRKHKHKHHKEDKHRVQNSLASSPSLPVQNPPAPSPSLPVQNPIAVVNDPQQPNYVSCARRLGYEGNDLIEAKAYIQNLCKVVPYSAGFGLFALQVWVYYVIRSEGIDLDKILEENKKLKTKM